MPLSAWFDAIKLNRFLDQIDDFLGQDFELLNYDSHPFISAPIAV